jgi:hypothetical protein
MMTISEYARLYLENYYVLDETRNELRGFLEDIAKQSLSAIDAYIKDKKHPLIEFKSYLQKDGGHIEVYYHGAKPLDHLEHLDAWRFSIYYYDAMRTTELTEPTRCRIHGVTPQNRSKQISELRRVAKILDLPDPYTVTEIDLVDRPTDDVIRKIVSEYTSRYDVFIRLIEYLLNESESLPA